MAESKSRDSCSKSPKCSERSNDRVDSEPVDPISSAELAPLVAAIEGEWVDLTFCLSVEHDRWKTNYGAGHSNFWQMLCSEASLCTRILCTRILLIVTVSSFDREQGPRHRADGAWPKRKRGCWC